MKKETKNDHNNQRVLSADKLEEYLQSIKFDERSAAGKLTPEEFKKIILTNLQGYFQGKATQAFIIELVFAIEGEVPAEDDVLWTVISDITDLVIPKVRNKKTPAQIDEIFRSSLEMLEKDLQKNQTK